jgi:hypothetical protein
LNRGAATNAAQLVGVVAAVFRRLWRLEPPGEAGLIEDRLHLLG